MSSATVSLPIQKANIASLPPHCTQAFVLCRTYKENLPEENSLKDRFVEYVVFATDSQQKSQLLANHLFQGMSALLGSSDGVLENTDGKGRCTRYVLFSPANEEHSQQICNRFGLNIENPLVCIVNSQAAENMMRLEFASDPEAFQEYQRNVQASFPGGLDTAEKIVEAIGSVIKKSDTSLSSSFAEQLSIITHKVW